MTERVHCKRCGAAFETIPDFDAHECPDPEPDTPDDGMLLADGGRPVNGNEFQWVDVRDLVSPSVTEYLEERDGQQFLIAHEDLNPFGWIATTEPVEVRR